MSSINPCGIPVLDIGRDVNGRFRKANPGGPGNPFARKVAALRKTLLDSVSEQDLKAMIEILKQQALSGDKAAIKLILQYCVGKPESPKDPDHMDIDEWDRLQQMRVSEGQFTKTTESVPACLACHVAGTHWPCNIQDTTGPFAHAIHLLHSQMTAAPNTPTEPAASPPTPCPSSAQATPMPSERREPAGQSRRDRRSPTQPPLPNGGIGEEQPQARQPRQPLRPPSQPSGQSPRKPPPR